MNAREFVKLKIGDIVECAPRHGRSLGVDDLVGKVIAISNRTEGVKVRDRHGAEFWFDRRKVQFSQVDERQFANGWYD